MFIDLHEIQHQTNEVQRNKSTLVGLINWTNKGLIGLKCQQVA